MSESNIYQRRNSAKKQVYEHEFEKVKGTGLKYAYLPIERIKPIVEKAWNDNGILLDIVNMDLSNVREPFEKKSYEGNISTWFHVKGELTFRLVNMFNPSDNVEFTSIGEATDNSDKVINKVYTSAIKNFYKLEFNISEGPKDDTDAIQSEDDLEPKRKSRPVPQTDDPFFNKKPKEPAAFTNADELPEPPEVKEEERLAKIILAEIEEDSGIANCVENTVKRLKGFRWSAPTLQGVNEILKDLRNNGYKIEGVST